MEMPSLRDSDEQGGSTHREGKGSSLGHQLASIVLTITIK